MRADAEANRTGIQEAASEVYAATRTPSLRSIARRAGISQGTLYRHFPGRTALVLKVYQHEVHQTRCLRTRSVEHLFARRRAA